MRIERLVSFVALSGIAALAGCSSIQTTHQYAVAHNWRPIETQGTQYFCRREQPEVPGSPLTGVTCVTRRQLLALKTTDEYATSHGYRPIVVKGTQYYCRDGQPETADSLPAGADCISRADVRAQLAQIPPLDTVPWQDYSVGVVPAPHSATEISLGLWR